MKRFILSSLTTAAIFTVALSSGSASALADTKIFPATLCRNTLSGILAFTDESNRLFNASFISSARVVCPIVRDNHIGKPTSIQVTVVDNSSAISGANFSCRVHHSNPIGTSGVAGAFVVTAGTNSAGQVLSLPIPTTVFVDGPYSVDCTIPRRGVGDPSSFINSIKVVEVNAAN